MTPAEALEIATAAHVCAVENHDEQLRRLVTVAKTFDDATLQTAALLHNIVQTTPWKIEDLRACGANTQVLAIVRALTRHNYQTTAEYNANIIAAGKEAIAVKLAFLEYDLAHIAQLPAPMQARLQEPYEKARVLFADAYMKINE